MTVPQFFGCALIAFGPPLVMFCLTIAHQPVRVIVMICAAFAWLVSFLSVSICWALLASWAQYLAIGAFLSVISQELFRYFFHIITVRAHKSLTDLISQSNKDESNHPSQNGADNSTSSQQQSNSIPQSVRYKQASDRLALSYVSGLGYGAMSGAFAFVNVLVDSIGPGNTGLYGDSQYFFLISAITTLSFILLNVCWSVLTAESIETNNKKLLAIVVCTHLIATAATFLNRVHYQFVSLMIVNSILIGCSILTFETARRILTKRRNDN